MEADLAPLESKVRDVTNYVSQRSSFTKESDSYFTVAISKATAQDPRSNMASDDTNSDLPHTVQNYCAYIDPETGRERVGFLDPASALIQPLAYKSGTPLSNLYEVIEAGREAVAAAGDPIPRFSVRFLAPIGGRDILCVGKNYSEHAKEFNKSGYDSSDKTDQPTHPVRARTVA